MNVIFNSYCDEFRHLVNDRQKAMAPGTAGGEEEE